MTEGAVCDVCEPASDNHSMHCSRRRPTSGATRGAGNLWIT
jgi:hypothetical protein